MNMNIRRAMQQDGVRVLFNFLRQEITITCREKWSKLICSCIFVRSFYAKYRTIS